MNTSMEKKADDSTSWIDAISNWAKENPHTLNNMLAAGGVGALGGGLLTEGDADDTTADKIRKKLVNALLVGGAAAGAVGLGSQGADTILNTPDPAERSTIEHIKDFIGVPGIERDGNSIAGLLYGGFGLGGAAAGLHHDAKRLKSNVDRIIGEVANLKTGTGKNAKPMYNIVKSDSTATNIKSLIDSNKNGKLAENLSIAAGSGGRSAEEYRRMLEHIGVGDAYKGSSNPVAKVFNALRHVGSGPGKRHIRIARPAGRAGIGAAIGMGIPAALSAALGYIDHE